MQTYEQFANIMQLNETQLNGKYANGEINTSLQFVAVNANESNGLENGWFAQGDNASNIINDILLYWQQNDCTQEQAFDWYINTYLY